MFGKIAIIQFFLMLAMAGAGVAYFHYTEGVINGLHEDNAKLQVAVSTQQATIEAQQKAAKAQAEQTVVLQQTIDDAEAQRRELADKLRNKDIAAMARANSVELEQRINRATAQAFSEITKLTTPQDRPTPAVATNTNTNTTAASSPSKPVVTTPIPTTSNTLKPSNYQPPPKPPASSKGATP
jgi:hypothetical protein